MLASSRQHACAPISHSSPRPLGSSQSISPSRGGYFWNLNCGRFWVREEALALFRTKSQVDPVGRPKGGSPFGLSRCHCNSPVDGFTERCPVLVGSVWQGRNTDTGTGTCHFWASSPGPSAVRWQVSTNLSTPSPASPTRTWANLTLTRQTAT